MATLVTEREALGNIRDTTSGFSIFLIVFVIVLGLGTGVFIANTFFFAEIRKSGCGTKISTSEAEVMFWLNLVLTILSALLVLIAIFILVFSRAEPVWTRRYLGRFGYSPGTSPGGIYTGAVLGYQEPEQIQQLAALRQVQEQLRGQVAAEEAARAARVGQFLRQG